MAVVRTTTCELCGVDLEIRRIKNSKGVWRVIPALAVRPGPSEPDNYYRRLCEPGGPSHKEVK